jgi:uncharacterized protein YoaH (UPF0181 family)
MREEKPLNDEQSGNAIETFASELRARRTDGLLRLARVEH